MTLTGQQKTRMDRKIFRSEQPLHSRNAPHRQHTSQKNDQEIDDNDNFLHKTTSPPTEEKTSGGLHSSVKHVAVGPTRLTVSITIEFHSAFREYGIVERNIDPAVHIRRAGAS